MKKSLSLFAILFYSMILTAPVSAGEHRCPIANKIKRGVVNIISSPLEIPKQIHLSTKKGAKKTPHVAVWAFSGLVKGLVNTVARLGSGAWDVFTCNLDIPKNNQPLMKPDYVFGNDCGSTCATTTCSKAQPTQKE